MSTLSKFQQLKASSKTTNKNNIIMCLEITLRKIQKPYLTLRLEVLVEKEYIYIYIYIYIYLHIYIYTYTYIGTQAKCS